MILHETALSFYAKNSAAFVLLEYIKKTPVTVPGKIVCPNWINSNTTPHKEGKTGQSIRGGILIYLDTHFFIKFTICTKK